MAPPGHPTHPLASSPLSAKEKLSPFDPADRGRFVAGRYELIEPVGEGGMALVWKASMHMAAGLRRTVALKKMKPELRSAQNHVAMFFEEARVAADLGHHNIVQLLDFVEDNDGLYCLVMEWVEGVDLRVFLRAIWSRAVTLPWQMVAGIGVGTLRGLAAAHGRRLGDGQTSPIVHRDVTPSNILLGRNGVVKLADFGLARARDRMQSLTAPGVIKGKLAYLAPEIVQGEAASIASDIFGVGCVLWEALAGEPLFDGKTDVDVFRRVRAGQIRPLFSKREDLPPMLIECVHQALAANPQDRQRSAQQMAGELAQIIASAPLPGDAQDLLGRAVAEVKAWNAGGGASQTSTTATVPGHGTHGRLAGVAGDESKLIQVKRGSG